MSKLSAEGKRIRHNAAQRKHYYLKKSGYVRLLLTDEEKRKRHNLIQRKHAYPKLYGISIEQYNILLDKQNQSCAICEINISNLRKPLSVDHDHKTNKVRGLVCQKCNLILGFSNDDIKILKKTIKYMT